MQPRQYLRQDSLAFRQRLTIRETQHVIAEAIQFLCSSLVGNHRFRLEVLVAVKFDDQHRFDAGEIREVVAHGTLAAEFVAAELTVSQRRPQASLGVG